MRFYNTGPGAQPVEYVTLKARPGYQLIQWNGVKKAKVFLRFADGHVEVRGGSLPMEIEGNVVAALVVDHYTGERAGHFPNCPHVVPIHLFEKILSLDNVDA